MLKVLIADDEAKVIQLIEYLVDWSAYGMEIIARTGDGQRALELIKKERPDVVITDIRMPNINGIELVQQTAEAGLAPFFVIISGYSEFAYAQKAIQLGVEDYLLKPLKKKDLEAVLNKICRKYELMHQSEAERDSLLSRLSKSRDIARHALLTDLLIRHDTAAATMSPESFEEEYGFRLLSTRFLCILLHLYTDTPDETASNEELYAFLLPKLMTDMESRLAPLPCSLISMVYNHELVSLLSVRETDQTAVLEELQKLKINLMNYRSIYPAMRIAIGVSKPCTSLASFEACYRDALQTLNHRFFHEDGFLFLSSDDAPAGSGTGAVTASEEKELVRYVELLSDEEFRQVMDGIREHLKEPPTDGFAVAEACQTVMQSVLYAIRPHEEALFQSGIDEDYLLRGMACLYSFDALWDWLTDTISELLLRYANEKQSQEDRPIRQAKLYIQEHFAEAISLETVSNEVGFNPAYFSTVFKKSTGQNFMDYVKELRISSAKDMLIHSNMDIASIAAAVGYSDIKYFSRLFRKLTRLTPSEYRKMYG